MPDAAVVEAPDYRKITDALAGALQTLSQKRKVVEDCQTALHKANEEYENAKAVAGQVRAKLDEHLREVLPPANPSATRRA